MKYYLFILTILISLCIVTSYVYSYDYEEWKVISAEGIDISYVGVKDKEGRYVDNFPIWDDCDKFYCSKCVVELEEIYDELLEENTFIIGSEVPIITVYLCPNCNRKYIRKQYIDEEKIGYNPVVIQDHWICGTPYMSN